MPEQTTYKLFEIIKADTSVIEVSAGDPRFIIQLLDKDSRTAADRARAEKARQEIEQAVQDLIDFDQRLIFLESFYTNDNTVVDFSSLQFVSGSFQGEADFSFLEIEDTLKYKAENNFLISSQSNDTTLLIGNQFNNFTNKQTTTFRNADVIVSGSLQIVDGVLQLEAKNSLPDTVIKGALVFTIDNHLFIGTV